MLSIGSYEFSHEFFEKYVNSELKLKIFEETNRHAAQRKQPSSMLEDLELFNSILLLTGHHSLLHTKIFWEKEDDIGLSIVYEAMSGKEFGDFKSFIYFADNNFPILYSIDEQMMPYIEKNSSKQTI